MVNSMFFDTIEEGELVMGKPASPPFPAEATLHPESFVRDLLRRLRQENVGLPDDALELLCVFGCGLPDRMPVKLHELIARHPKIGASELIHLWVRIEFGEHHDFVLRRTMLRLRNARWTPLTEPDAVRYNTERGHPEQIQLARYKNPPNFRSLLSDPRRPARSAFAQRMVDLAVLIYAAGARANGMKWTNHLLPADPGPVRGATATIYERPDRAFWLWRRPARGVATSTSPHST